jgi:hypothetical protein
MNADRRRLEEPSSMNEMLAELYTTPEPDAVFVARLEQQLRKQVEVTMKANNQQPTLRQAQANAASSGTVARENPLANRRWSFALSRHRWATAAAVVVLAVALVLAAVGPQRAWAAIQQWLGYVPGVGFVDLQDTKILAAPVAITQAGITVQVEQVLARPHKTTVVFRSEGLPREDHLWPEMMRDDHDYHFALHLPDGRVLTTQTWTLRLGGGTLEFPPLPEGATTVMLTMGRLPLVPPDFGPEAWSIPLTLQPATNDLIAALYPQPYTPVDAAATRNDVTMRVLEVAHTPEETAVRLQLQWSDPAWQMHFLTGGTILPYLEDESGQVYRYSTGSSGGSRVQTVVRSVDEVTPTPFPERPTIEGTIHFWPASPLAEQLTLVVSRLEFQVTADAAFTFDLGPEPQVGDSWPLDLRLDVAGFPVLITAARLIEEVIDQGPGRESIPRLALQFDQEPIPPVGDRVLSGFGLDGSRSGFTGGSGRYAESGHWQMAVTVGRDEPLPTGLVSITIPRASVMQQGPWEITWEVP